VIVGVHRLLASDFAPHNLDGSIADDFVGIHVRRRATTGLEDVDDKLIVVIALHHFPGGLLDGVSPIRIELAHLLVGPGRGPFHQTDRPDEGSPEPPVTDGKVFLRTNGLCSVISVLGHLNFTETVRFNAMFRGHDPHSLLFFFTET
jgi:hypothetical protein